MVKEAYAAGIHQAIFVTGRIKRRTKDYLDTTCEMESDPDAASKKELLALDRSIAPDDPVTH